MTMSECKHGTPLYAHCEECRPAPVCPAPMSYEEEERLRAEITRLRAELAETQKATADSIGEEWRAMERRAEAAERDRDAAKAEAERMREALLREESLVWIIENTSQVRVRDLALDMLKRARAAIQEEKP